MAPLHHVWTYPKTWAVLPPEDKWQQHIGFPGDTEQSVMLTSIDDILSDISEVLSIYDKTFVFLLGHGDKDDNSSENANQIISRARVLGWELLLRKQFEAQIPKKLSIQSYCYGTKLNIDHFNVPLSPKAKQASPGHSVYPEPTSYNRRVDIFITQNPDPAIIRGLNSASKHSCIKEASHWKKGKKAKKEEDDPEYKFNKTGYKSLKEALKPSKT